ncbi:MAG: hypothetical protein RMH84_00960 [Sulfolobales archaeon]|nr:hypothetical protein [Sulfolobales archaeon]
MRRGSAQLSLTSVVATIFVAAVLAGGGLYAFYSYSDDLLAVFSSWLSGEPTIMVKLEIPVPRVDADSCAVAVRRLPTTLRPTATWYSEEVYNSMRKPGDVVVVRQILPAIVAKYRTDPEPGGYKVDYYEPVTNFVAVVCAKNGELRYSYGRVHEVFPRELVTTYRVEVELEERGPTQPLAASPEAGAGSPQNYSGLRCNITITSSYGYSEWGYCITWVRGPYIYSMNDLGTRFKISRYPRPSAAYLESFYYSDILCASQYPRWESAGKNLVPTTVEVETLPLQGNLRDRVYFQVMYNYERGYVGSPSEWVACLWLLYPVEIVDARRSAQLAGLVPFELSSYSPPPAPAYARGPTSGNRVIGFDPPYTSDTVAVSIGVSVTYKGFTLTVTVNFYKAGRNDNTYTTPSVVVEDVSGRTTPWYYWWYKDNGRMTYEVMFSNYR